MSSFLWKHGSVPSSGTVVMDGQVILRVPLLEMPGKRNAEVHWYSPIAVRAYDLDPTLTDAEGAQHFRDALAISIPRRPVTATPGDTLWVSLTYPLDPVGLDFSGIEAIELWVNDWRDEARVRGPGLRLHVDLGRVSEDQMRAPDLPPNLLLDTEDRRPRDNFLILEEDTGIDGVDDSASDALTAPVDLVTANEQDRMGDDFGLAVDTYAELDPRRWTRINGTEGNLMAYPIPDGEDLNLNERLDSVEAYFEYTIDLSEGSRRYLVTDVHEEFAGQAVPYPPGPDNGWRRYRIPIDDSLRVRFGEPDLSYALQLRIWVDGIVSPDGPGETPGQIRPLLMLAGIETPPDIREFIGSGSPNPFVTSTTFAYRLETPAHVRSVVLDLHGREVVVLEDAQRERGPHTVTWDGRQADGRVARPGIYFVRAHVNGTRDRVWRVVRIP